MPVMFQRHVFRQPRVFLQPFVFLQRLAFFCLPLLLAACAAPTTNVPETYKGPVAIIRDTAVSQTSNKANIFYLKAVDGQAIRNSLIATRQDNAGRGFALGTTEIERPVLPQAGVFSVAGRTEYGAPIQALTGTVYQVAGEVRFTPEAGKRYVVRGELGEQYCAVWIEEAGTRAVVGEKVELKGSGKLGFFEK
jgi:hypothetical protein